eukprot:EG_transcript_27576
MAIAMLEDTLYEGELLLQDADFPPNYINFAHPDDYTIQPQAIQQEHIYLHRHPAHKRLLLRVSLKLRQNEFVPMTFVIDTGAPQPLWLGRFARRLLRDKGFLKKNGNEELILLVHGEQRVVYKTPRGHLPANMMGLPLLFDLGLRLSPFPRSFTFDDPFQFLELEQIEGNFVPDDQEIADPE